MASSDPAHPLGSLSFDDDLESASVAGTPPAPSLPRVVGFPPDRFPVLPTMHTEASWFARVSARLLDLVPLSGVAFALSYLLPLAPLPPSFSTAALPVTVALSVLLYEVLSLAVWGRTLGKFVCGVRVVRESDPVGAAPGLGLLPALVRPFAMLVLGGPLLALSLWAGTALFEGRTMFWDRLLGLMVASD